MIFSSKGRKRVASKDLAAVVEVLEEELSSGSNKT